MPKEFSTRATTAAYALVAWLGWCENQLLARLVFRRRIDLDFVLANVRGVLGGTPVVRIFQHRFLGPLGVAALDPLTHDRETSLHVFLATTALAGNVLLFEFLRRRGATLFAAATGAFALALARLFLAYRLEYPWDGLDVLLFLTFGDWAARGRGLLPFWPFLALGAINHETVLFVPLWYALSVVFASGASSFGGRTALHALIAFAAVSVLVVALREYFYAGAPKFEGADFEPGTPFIGNPIHIEHNLRQLFFENWRAGRAFNSVTFFGAVSRFATLAIGPTRRASALWSLCVLGSVVTFGYVNETRLYLPLAAFWLSHAWPLGDQPVSHAA